MTKFEVALHNEEVRRCVKEDERHREFNDDWADIHYIEVNAEDEQEARRKIESRYPSSKGFVIQIVVEIKEEG